MPHSPARDADSAADSPVPVEPRYGWRSGFADALAFSNGLPAAIAVGLSLVASQSLRSSNAAHSALIAGCGTFVVYGLDRLRDTARDRTTSPLRTRFTIHHARALGFAVALAAVVLLAALPLASPWVVLLCCGVGGLGLLHRRLKDVAGLKTLYVSLSWVACCVGIPWINALPRQAARPALWIVAILFTAIAANLVASNHRDGEARLLRGRPGWTPVFACSIALIGVLLAFAAPIDLRSELRPLSWIPLAEAVALAFYRPTEHYGQLVVDGALFVGSIASLLQLAT
jgi:4-hydroxybenzoate polyprenyltransferase